MKIGFLGTGMIVKDLMRTVDKLPFEKKVLLGTPNTREETEAIAKENHFDSTFYDYDELLASDVDTIYVALPNFLHYSFAKKAIAAGKHVIVEKPITSNMKELEDLKKDAKEKNVFIFEAMNIHYLPSYLGIKEHLDELGDIKIVSLNYSQYSHRYDAFKAGETLPVFDPKKSGGALMDINVYNIHFVVGLFGRPKAVQYSANVEKGIDTSGILTLDYGTFKAVTIGAKDCKATVLGSIQGDKGCIQVHKPANQITAFEVDDNDGGVKNYEYDNETHRLYYEFMEFIRIVNENDVEKANQMLEISTIVQEVMTQARKDAGIVFPCDEA